MESVAESFLAWAFPTIEKTGQQIAIWSPKKKTSFHRTAALAAEAGEASAAEGLDVYFGVCSLASPPSRGRGALKDMGALWMLWADVDVAGEAHDKPGLPTDMKQAEALIESIKLEPSAVIHSGNGLQAYWFLDRPRIFKSEADREDAVRLAAHWGATVKVCAAANKWTVDPVFDLPRVMRLPGTHNRKGKEPKPVTVRTPFLGEEPNYILPLEVEFALVPESYLETKRDERAIEIVVDPVIADKSRAEPPGCVALMCQGSKRFSETWERKRKDGGAENWSASEYDLSLAQQMAIGEASDEDIANALYHRRLKFGEKPEKALRRDYVMKTLALARESAGRTRAIEEVVAAPNPMLADTDEEKSSARAVTLAAVSKAMGITITGIIQQGKESANFSLILGDGTDVKIGGIKHLLNQGDVQAVLAEQTRIVIAGRKQYEWHRVVERLLRCAEIVENDETHRPTLIADWLRRYFERFPPPSQADDLEWRQSILAGRPFVHAPKKAGPEWLCLQSVHFGGWCRGAMALTIGRGEIFDLFRMAKLATHKVSVWDAETSKPITRAIWRAELLEFEEFLGADIRARRAIRKEEEDEGRSDEEEAMGEQARHERQ